MCAREKNYTHIVEIMGYSLPTYHEGKKSYVDFYAYDAVSGTVRRKKYHLDGISSKKRRKEQAHQLILQLSKKLSQGWRPWSTQKGSERGYTEIDECLRQYLARINEIGKPRTIKTYTSNVRILQKYLKSLPTPPRYICEFNKSFVTEFLDWLLVNRKVCARTRNNYRNWLNILSEYLIKRRYITENPVDDTEKLKEKVKRRKPLTAEMLTKLTSYLREKDKNFLLAVMLEYYCFIRPAELQQLRIRDISVKEQSIKVNGEISKNGRTATVALNSTIIKLMIETGCLTSPIDYYLFSNDFKPGPEPTPYNAINREWSKVREALGFGEEYQFYSLKDSGIRDLANSAGIVYAKRQARHTDISTTNKYIEGEGMPLPQEVKNFKGGIG